MAREIVEQNDYFMINIGNTNLALDIAGSSKVKGANLRVYTKNDTYAQIVRPVDVHSRTTDAYEKMHRIVLPLSGQCVSTEQAGTLTAGDNVKQTIYHSKESMVYDKKTRTHSAEIKNMSLANQFKYGMLWYFDCTGTFTYNSKTYRKYRVLPAASISLCIAAESGTSGANVSLRSHSYSNSEWILVPVSATVGGYPAQGYYNIVSANWKNYALGVPGYSVNNGVQMKLHNRNGESQGQQFFVDYLERGTYCIRPMCTKDKYLTVKNATAANNTPIVQQAWYYGYPNLKKAQKWHIRPSGTKTKLDGKNYPIYKFWSFVNVPDGTIIDQDASAFNFALDFDSYKESNLYGDGAELWDYASTPGVPNYGNKLLLIPTDVVDVNMPTPTNLTISSYPGESGYTNLVRRGSLVTTEDAPWNDRDIHEVHTVIWPTWECEDGWTSGNNAYDWRYRIRYHGTLRGRWYEWSPWTEWRPAIISYKEKLAWITDGLTLTFSPEIYYKDLDIYEAQGDQEEAPVKPYPSEDDIDSLPDDEEIVGDEGEIEDDDPVEIDDEYNVQSSETTSRVVRVKGCNIAEIEFEVRSTGMSDGSKIVSAPASKTAFVHYWPQFTDFQAPIIESNGLRLTFKTDYIPNGGSNNLTVRFFGSRAGAPIANENYILENLQAENDGTVSGVIPWEKLKRVPAVGEQLYLRYRTGTDTFTTMSSGYIPDYSVLLPPIVESEDVQSLHATYRYDDVTMTLLVTFDKFAEFNYYDDEAGIVNEFWTKTPTNRQLRTRIPFEGYQLSGTRVVELETETTYTYRFVYPFGKDFDVIIIENGDLEQGISVLHIPQRTDVQPFHMWNFGDGIARIAYTTDSAGFVSSNSLEPSYNEVELLGRNRSTVTFGNVTKSSFSATGALYDEANDPAGNEEALRALQKAQFATYRSPRGHYVEVAITGLTIERHIGYSMAQVSMIEVSQ